MEGSRSRPDITYLEVELLQEIEELLPPLVELGRGLAEWAWHRKGGAALDFALERLSRHGAELQRVASDAARRRGLLRTLIRQWLHDRRAEHDPAGAKAYRTVQRELTRQQQRRQLRLESIEGAKRERFIDATCRLAGEGEAVHGLELEARLRSSSAWAAAVSACQPGRRGAQPALREVLATLAAGGVRAFRVADLVEALSSDARELAARQGDVRQARLVEDAELRLPAAAPEANADHGRSRVATLMRSLGDDEDGRRQRALLRVELTAVRDDGRVKSFRELERETGRPRSEISRDWQAIARKAHLLEQQAA